MSDLTQPCYIVEPLPGGYPEIVDWLWALNKAWRRTRAVP
jgi:hypothetical protein